MLAELDLVQIFWGDTTLELLLEITLRTTVLFIFTLLMLRLVGHRSLSQLSFAELVLILALGSAVGDPMFYADIPLIHGMTVIALIVIYQFLATTATMRSRTAASVIDGYSVRLVVDGLLDLQGITRARVTQQEVFSELRQAGVRELGEIQRAYLETDGQVSVFVYPEEHVRIGLPIMPRNVEECVELSRGAIIPTETSYSCLNCGYTHPMDKGNTLPHCPRCQHEKWTESRMPSSALHDVQEDNNVS
jgi:uncharacterized membrane protein YcaP (DUF421 family)